MKAITPAPVRDQAARDIPSPRDSLIALYQRHRPDKVRDVDRLLGKYQGRETELLAAVRAKYGEAIVLSDSDSDGDDESDRIHGGGATTAAPDDVPVNQQDSEKQQSDQTAETDRSEEKMLNTDGTDEVRGSDGDGDGDGNDSAFSFIS